MSGTGIAYGAMWCAGGDKAPRACCRKGLPSLRPAPYALYPTPYTLHPTPYALRPAPYALRPTPYALRQHCDSACGDAMPSTGIACPAGTGRAYGTGCRLRIATKWYGVKLVAICDVTRERAGTGAGPVATSEC
eukprot:2677490-Rhodomonas_salina.1